METFLSEVDVIKGDGSENNQAFESTQEDKDRSIGTGPRFHLRVTEILTTFQKIQYLFILAKLLHYNILVWI